ncbi:PepSY domain-containing protein [Ramlibacter cellulosilyticus]
MKPVRLLLCAVMLAAAGLPAWAQVSRDDAAVVAQRETGGRVLSVERVDAGGRPMWRVKVVTGRGEVRVVLVDMATGQTR